MYFLCIEKRALPVFVPFHDSFLNLATVGRSNMNTRVNKSSTMSSCFLSRICEAKCDDIQIEDGPENDNLAQSICSSFPFLSSIYVVTWKPLNDSRWLRFFRFINQRSVSQKSSDSIFDSKHQSESSNAKIGLSQEFRTPGHSVLHITLYSLRQVHTFNAISK